MSRTIPSFAEEGLKRFLHGMDRRIRDLERLGQWNFDEDPLPDAEFVARGGIGQVLMLSTSTDPIASGGDYVTFSSVMQQHGFGDPVSPGQIVTWPASAVGEVQVEIAWASFEGGGRVELEIDGVIPAWGLLGDATVGRVGIKRRAVHIEEGAQVRIKVTHNSGSAQDARVVGEFAIPDPTGTSGAFTGTLITSAIPAQNTSVGATFFDDTFSFSWDGTGSLVIANTSDGTGAVSVDDKIRVDVTHADASTATYEVEIGLTPAGPLDVTSYFESGTNTVRVRLIDVHGAQVSSDELWLVNV